MEDSNSAENNYQRDKNKIWVLVNLIEKRGRGVWEPRDKGTSGAIDAGFV